MHHLYHGSGYKQTELKPGFHHTGTITKWDKTESNEWLYATTLMEEAIAQGLASVAEKHWKLARFQSSNNDLVLIFDGACPTRKHLEELTVYLYKIDWDKDAWIRVDNLHNGMTNEYKTKSIIHTDMIDDCTQVNIRQWMSRKNVIIKSKTAAMNW